LKEEFPKPEFTDMEQRILYKIYDSTRRALAHIDTIERQLNDHVWSEIKLEDDVTYIKKLLHTAKQMEDLLHSEPYDYTAKEEWLQQEFPTIFENIGGINKKDAPKLNAELQALFKMLDRKVIDDLIS
jgi:hypothetical protein